MLGACGEGSRDKKTSGPENIRGEQAPDALLDSYRTQTSYTDPGAYAYLYSELPASAKKLCALIKKQLIHPMEAAEMPDLFPPDRLPEDGSFPKVSSMLAELEEREPGGLATDRLPENRLLVACYHHGLMLASMLRHQGKPVRLRAGFARYYEEWLDIRFSHVLCEVWDEEDGHWYLLDPDRNLQNLKRKKFEFPSEVWINYQNRNLPDITYVGSMGQGEKVYLHSLLLDMAFVLGDERNYWHTPEFIFQPDFAVEKLPDEELLILNLIAELMKHPDQHREQLGELYEKHPFIQSHQREIESYYNR